MPVEKDFGRGKNMGNDQILPIRSDIRFISLIISLTLIYSFDVHHFIIGYFNLLGINFILALILIISLLVFMVRFMFQWRRVDKRRKIIRLAILGLVPALIVVGFYTVGPPIRSYTYGFREGIRMHADIEAIEKWKKTLKMPDGEERAYYVDQSQWPLCIKKLSPGHVSVWSDGDLSLTWGSFARWGVVFGHLRDSKANVFPIQSNVYVWYGDQ
jgi:hypothetical protein